MCTVACPDTDLQEPLLVLLMRYLLHLHGVLQYSLPQAPKPGQSQDLLDSLLLAGREPAPLPLEHYQGPLREADVQAVIQCTGTTRTAAVAALRRSGGARYWLSHMRHIDATCHALPHCANVH